MYFWHFQVYIPSSVVHVIVRHVTTFTVCSQYGSFFQLLFLLSAVILGAGIAQLEHWLKVKSQLQYWQGFKSLVRQGIFLLESTSSTDSQTVKTPCAIACIQICGHITNHKHWQPYHCLDTEMLHTPTEMGSAALAAAVPYQVKQPKFPTRDDEVLKNKK